MQYFIYNNLEKINVSDIDILLLDIDLMNLKIKNVYIKNDIRIIFLINENNNIKKVFDLLSITYILKNLINEQIEITIENIIKLDKLLSEKSHTSSISSISRISGFYDEKIFLLSFDEIIYLRADGDYTDIITKSGLIYKSKFSLKYLTERLKKTNFFRCHRSFLVNIDKVKEIAPSFNYTLELSFNNCKEKVPVGRKYIKEFKEIVGL